MSVATKNPFAILDGTFYSFIILHLLIFFSPDDQDLDDAPQKEEEPTSPQPPAPSRGTAKSRGGGPAARAGKYYNRGGKTQAPKETPVAEEPANDNQRKCSSRLCPCIPYLLSQQPAPLVEAIVIVNAVMGGVVGGVIQAEVVLTTDTVRPGKRTSSPFLFDSLNLIIPTAIPTRRSTILGAETTATPSSRPRKPLPMTLPPKQPTAGVVLLPMVGV